MQKQRDDYEELLEVGDNTKETLEEEDGLMLKERLPTPFLSQEDGRRGEGGETERSRLRQSRPRAFARVCTLCCCCDLDLDNISLHVLVSLC